MWFRLGRPSPTGTQTAHLPSSHLPPHSQHPRSAGPLVSLFLPPGIYACSFLCLECSPPGSSVAHSYSSFRSLLQRDSIRGGPPQMKLHDITFFIALMELILLFAYCLLIICVPHGKPSCGRLSIGNWHLQCLRQA